MLRKRLKMVVFATQSDEKFGIRLALTEMRKRTETERPPAMKPNNLYLLVTHIPFARDAEGAPVVDGLWARDLIGLAKSVGALRVVAPELPLASLTGWGPNTVSLSSSPEISFRGFAPINGKKDLWRWPSIRRVLRQEVNNAQLVHTSNLFPPYLGLSYAHDYATRLGRKTLFVIAEDFRDMLSWEWIRESAGLRRWMRERELDRIEQRARKSAATASLTLLHTPAAVERYRLWARRSVAIRQPGHDPEQIISAESLEQRLASLDTKRPLHLVSACRHAGLKGLDLLIQAAGLLHDRGIEVEVTLYGKGPQTAQLNALAERLGIADRVHTPGALAAGPELDAALRRADLFVMPHRSTDFGRAFFDAMAAGLPVLAFRTPASADTVYDGLDGFLAPLDDVQGLAERIATLDRDRSLLARTANSARTRAVRNTRTEWFRMRAQWTLSLLSEQSNAA